MEKLTAAKAFVESYIELYPFWAVGIAFLVGALVF